MNRVGNWQYMDDVRRLRGQGIARRATSPLRPTPPSSPASALSASTSSTGCEGGEEEKRSREKEGKGGQGEGGRGGVAGSEEKPPGELVRDPRRVRTSPAPPLYPEEYETTLKLVVVGPSGVGKSARESFPFFSLPLWMDDVVMGCRGVGVLTVGDDDGQWSGGIATISLRPRWLRRWELICG
jgi:hypothetical protein